jgi:hypothetical protein
LLSLLIGWLPKQLQQLPQLPLSFKRGMPLVGVTSKVQRRNQEKEINIILTLINVNVRLGYNAILTLINVNVNVRLG